MRPLIFDIQRFSIHDGPGIRTVVFFKGCNLACPWCQNPESIAHRQEIAFYPEKCSHNKDCGQMCTKGAISYQADDVVIDRNICAACDACTVVCSSGAIRVIGRQYPVKDVVNEILLDIDYYRTSGGGVTFSGGEPTLHTDFIYDVLLECKKYNIHTNIETNGYFDWKKFQKILPLLDLIYFDVKIADTELHRQFLTKSNQKILENIKHLAAANAPVEFRIPLIPGYTATEKNLNEIMNLLEANGIEKIHLLPYHSMGEAKAEKICSPLPKLHQKPFEQETIETFKTQFRNRNIEPILYR